MRLLKVISFLFILSTSSFAWTPNEFDIYCEEFSTATGLLTSFITEATNPIHFKTNCLIKNEKALYEHYLHQSLMHLKKKKFQSPKGISLGPIVGTQAVKIYATDTVPIARTVGSCLPSGSRSLRKYSYLSFNPKKLRAYPKAIRYASLQHEIVHVVQHAQKFEFKSSKCHKVPDWLTESTADAMTYEAVKKNFTYRPQIGQTAYRSFYGLRNYSIAFGYSFPKNHRQVTENYYSSSFFHFLESFYYHDKYKYIAVYLNILPKEIVNSEDWLKWLNQLLKSDEKGPQKPLYLVYPEFIAHYANWGKDKFKKLAKSKEKREGWWLAKSFGGCKEITLTPKHAKQSLELKLEHISAKCIKVWVDGLEGGKEANIKIMAYDSSKKKLDNLHISTAYAQAKFVAINKDFNCYRDVTAKNKERTCINTPIMGKIKTGQNNEETLVKTWRSQQQKFISVNNKNLYLISHVPVKPSDKRDSKRTKQTVNLTIALDYTKFKPTSKKTAKKANSQVGLMGHGGAKNGSDIPTSGTETMDFSSMMNNEGLSKLMMGMNIPDVTASLRGIHMITLKDFEGSDENIKNNVTLSLIVEEPITVGSIGTFKANVMGGLGEEDSVIKMVGMSVDMSNFISNNGDEPSANIKIVEYSKELLHIKVQGTYCRGRTMQGGCLKVENFSAEIFKPLGLAYGSGGIKSMDTPGMKIYRKNHYNRVFSKGNLGLPKGFNSIGSDSKDNSNGNSQSSESNGENQKCTCSCSEFKRINQQIEASGDTRPENAGTFMGCMMSCMMQYMKCDEN